MVPTHFARFSTLSAFRSFGIMPPKRRVRSPNFEHPVSPHLRLKIIGP